MNHAHSKPEATPDLPETDPVWTVLEQAPPRNASPGFVPGVMRALEEPGRSAGGKVLPFPAARWVQMGAAAAAVLLVSLVIWIQRPGESTPPIVEAAPEVDPIATPKETEDFQAVVQEMELIALMGEAVAVSDPSMLADVALPELLF